MSMSIVRIGRALPGTVMDQTDALAIARTLAAPTQEQDTWIPGMYAGTNIHTRRLALPAQLVRDLVEGTRLSDSVFLPKGIPGERGPTTSQRMDHYVDLAPPLAFAACRDALSSGQVSPDQLTHLVTVSCTGFFAPGIDRLLVEHLGLRPTIERTHVGFMGCHGALNGLRVANAFAHDPSARILLLAVELCSLHYHYGYNPSKMIANAIFADGAAAVLGVPRALGPAKAWRVLATGSCYLPDSAGAMTWTIGDNGFEMTLSKSVPSLINRYLEPWLQQWLAGAGVQIKDVASWGVHPGGPRILSAVEEALGLTRDQTAASHEVFGECGNMSSPTVLFILERLISWDAPRPCVLLGFGPGLVAEATLIG